MTTDPNKLLARCEVAIVRGTGHYPSDPPFDPPDSYPEAPFKPTAPAPENSVYPMVRECLRLLGLDAARFGAADWNPLGSLISPGQRVLIKPNFVLHFNAGGGPIDAVVTHPSILRPIIDYVAIALRGRGEIILGDAPQMNCDLGRLFRAQGTDGMIANLTAECETLGIKFRARDFRIEQTVYKHGIVWKRIPLAGSRTIPVTLGSESYMDQIDSERLYGADYRRSATVGAHRDHRHQYQIASDALEADVVISVPKLKVHRKVGTTLNLKNMVGINTNKNHLAHYRIGPPAEGGDEFSSPAWDDRMERSLSDLLLGRAWRIGKYPFLGWKAFRKVLGVLGGTRRKGFAYGNWCGNDTAWRMALDLNRILLCADREGRISRCPTRGYFSVTDGIVGGQGEGPLAPEPYSSGVVLAGFNPVAVDWAGTRLMGLDPARIPMYRNAILQMQEWLPDLTPESFRVLAADGQLQEVLSDCDPLFKFQVPGGWRGSMERYSGEPEVTVPAIPIPGAISQ